MESSREIVCRTGEHELYGYRLDRGGERNLVLIPGSCTHHSIWELPLEHAGIAATILLAELPGFGKSRPRIPDGTIEQFTELTLALVDAAGFERFVIGGHSIGGMMAIEMLDHAADRLEGIVSCEGWTHASVQKDAYGGLKDETLTPEQAALVASFRAMGEVGWSREEISLYSRIWRKWQKGRRLLEESTVPVLELWGDRGMDRRPDREALQIPDRPNIRLEWIEHCGHNMLVQHPRKVGAAIARFMDDTARSR